MVIERGGFERESKISQLKEVFRRKGISAVLTDFDDTLIDTHKLFVRKMRNYCNAIVGGDEDLGKEAHQFMESVLLGLRSTYKVSPAGMIEPARLTALRYGRDYYSLEVQESVSRLMRIYGEEPVEKFPGVDETLGTIQAAGADTFLVTHAQEERTSRKIKHAGLTGMFQGVWCVDVGCDKDIAAWHEAFTFFKVDPLNTVVIGDNWTSDIAPALDPAIGVPEDQVFRVKTSYQEANRGRIEGVREIESFSKVIDALLEM